MRLDQRSKIFRSIGTRHSNCLMNTHALLVIATLGLNACVESVPGSFNDTSWSMTDEDDYLDLDEEYMIIGTPKADLLQGTADDEHILGLEDDDVLLGGAGEDLLEGGQGDDELDGGEGYDVVFGDEGDDTLHVSEGVDELYGGDGDVC